MTSTARAAASAQWGPAEFDRRFGAALRDFAARTRSWLTITTATGHLLALG